MSGLPRTVSTAVQWALGLNLAISTVAWSSEPPASDPPPIPPVTSSPSDVPTEQGGAWVLDHQRDYAPAQQCRNPAEELWTDYCATRGLHGLGCVARLLCAHPLLSSCNHCQDGACLGCGRADCLLLPHVLRPAARCTECAASGQCGCHRTPWELLTGRLLPRRRHAPVCAGYPKDSGEAKEPSPEESKTNADFVPVPPPLVDESVSPPSPPEPERSSPPEPEQTPVRINPAPPGPPRNILPSTGESRPLKLESHALVSFDHLFD